MTDLVVEVLVNGKPVDPFGRPPDCSHPSFVQHVTVAHIVGEAGEHVGWRLLVKVRCAECGRPFTFKTGTAGTSDDRLTLGALIEPKPLDRDAEMFAPTADSEPIVQPAVADPVCLSAWCDGRADRCGLYSRPARCTELAGVVTCTAEDAPAS